LLLAGVLPRAAWAKASMTRRQIPGTDESIPVIGLGTARTFDTALTPEEIDTRRRIVDLLFAEGGSLIDTSPMYGNAEAMLGKVFDASERRRSCFLATKVWTNGAQAGEQQMSRSMELMLSDVIDLMQVHNLRDFDTQFATIRRWQENGRIRYNGVTTSRESAFDDLADIMRTHRPQFIQINYSLGEREAEKRLLPMASDLGIAVLVNRPFVKGSLFRIVRNRSLPDWAGDLDIYSWGQFFLKFIASHQAVTCVIPATTNPKHMVDNLGAGFGAMPDATMRGRMADWIANL
jgi:diketogulonate reductase-like aldo/keto reductase